MKRVTMLLSHTLLPFVFLVLISGRTVAEPSVFSFALEPQAKTLYHVVEDTNDYIIALDKYKKKAGRWSPEKSQRAQGQLTRYTLEIAKHNNETDVFAFYRDQLPAQATQLFTCVSRACGESNNWANDHFGIKQLYGTNTSQQYGVFSINNADESVTYITIYTVRRGNRRLYTQLEVLRSH